MVDFVTSALLSFGIFFAQISANAVDRDDCMKDKKLCLSEKSTFKCALMFTNLTAEPEFITAIPDLLDQDPPESLREELEAKGVEREAFVMDDLCPSGNLTKAEIIKGLKGAFKRANARCYAYLNSYAKEPLKTCGGSLLGGDSKRIGDSMCGEAAGILAMRGIDTGVDWVQAGVYVSFCGGPWVAVKADQKPLVVRERLCCEEDNLRFRQCDGEGDGDVSPDDVCNELKE